MSVFQSSSNCCTNFQWVNVYSWITHCLAGSRMSGNFAHCTLEAVQWVHMTHSNQTDGRIHVGTRCADTLLVCNHVLMSVSYC